MTTQQATMLLIDLALIIAFARLLGALARKLDQPAVIGEIMAGILLGPTLFDGALADTLFPTDVRPYLVALANLGVAVFMFVVGLELDRSLLRGKGRIAITVSVTSLVLPFGLGALLAVYLAGGHQVSHRLGFILFMGAAMAVTAFPVLARILTDRGMNRTSLGGLALTCAAVGDLLAWALLAVVVALSGGGGAEQWRMLLAVPYLAVMFLVVRPLLRRLVHAWTETGKLTGAMTATIFVGLLVSGGVTEWIGLHFIFGAFLFGLIMPRAGAEGLTEDIMDRVGQVSAVVLLPVFFVVAGLKVDLSGGVRLGELGLILLVAISGKFLGAFFGARTQGLPVRQSAALATLMNTRGLTELVILSVGLQLGVLDESLYSLMVVMAVVTTAMAGPLLRVIYPKRMVEADRLAVVRDGGAVAVPAT